MNKTKLIRHLKTHFLALIAFSAGISIFEPTDATASCRSRLAKAREPKAIFGILGDGSSFYYQGGLWMTSGGASGSFGADFSARDPRKIEIAFNEASSGRGGPVTEKMFKKFIRLSKKEKPPVQIEDSPSEYSKFLAALRKGDQDETLCPEKGKRVPSKGKVVKLLIDQD